MRAVLIGVGLALVAGAGYWAIATQDNIPVNNQVAHDETAIVTVILPQTLTANAKIGKTVYDTKCAVCHAPNGVGQLDVAPPLVHII
jgi:cytochrome c